MKLPEGWRMASIGELAQFSSGHGFSPKEWSKIGLPIIRIQNLNGSRDFNYYDGEPEQEWIVEPGELLYAWAGTRGVSFGPTIWNGPRGVLNQHIYRVRAKEGIDEYWLYLILDVATRAIERRAHGFKSSLVHVRQSEITDQAVAVPCEDEQSRVAAVLGTWDRVVAQTFNLLKQKRELKKGMMQQLLTGKRRFGEFVMSKETHRADFFALPSDWDCPKIGDIASEVNERNSSGDTVPVLSCTKHDGLVDSLSYFGKRVFSEDTSAYKIVRHGQFAYATNHIEEGSIGLLESLDAGLVSPMYTVFQTADRVYAPFLYRVFKSDLYTQIFSANTNATVDRRGSLRWNQFKTIRVPLPSLPEQKKIAAVLDTVDKEVALLGAQLEALKLQKKSLMQKLLTGQKRVRV